MKNDTRWCGSMAEQLICNQQVVGSTPITSSRNTKEATACEFLLSYGSVPERPKGADCKSVVSDFGGPNPPAPTKKFDKFRLVEFFYPSRRLGISSPREAWCISSAPFGAVSHHALACIYLRLDDIQNFVLMICNSCGIDDKHAFGVILRLGSKPYYKTQKYLFRSPYTEKDRCFDTKHRSFSMISVSCGTGGYCYAGVFKNGAPVW